MNGIISTPDTDNQITMPFIFTLPVTLSGKEDSGLSCTGFTLNLKKTKVWTGYHHHVMGQDVVSCAGLLGNNWKGYTYSIENTMAAVVEPSSGSQHSPMKLHFMQFAAGGCAGKAPPPPFFMEFRIIVHNTAEEMRWGYHSGSI